MQLASSYANSMTSCTLTIGVFFYNVAERSVSLMLCYVANSIPSDYEVAHFDGSVSVSFTLS